MRRGLIRYAKRFVVSWGFAISAAALAQTVGPPFPRYDNPVDKPLPLCTCKNLEELQDQLASTVFAEQAFGEAAANSRAGPGELVPAERNRVGEHAELSIRTSVATAYTETGTSACTINDVETRRTAPCQEIYDAFRAHEEHHREICLNYWNNYGSSPAHFQTGREYFLEEVIAYQKARNVYRRALENILENSSVVVEFQLEQGQEPSRFDAGMKITLLTPSAMPKGDGRVEWFGKDAMSFSGIVHDRCLAPDVHREDVLTARTDDFFVLSFHHAPGRAVANFRCRSDGNFSTPMPALLAEEWKQYLLRDASLEVAAFGGVRDYDALIDTAVQDGLTLSAAALLKSVIATVDQPLYPPRTSFPWSPLVGRMIGGKEVVLRLNRGVTLITDKTRMGGRPELYLDDFAPQPMKITSKIHLDCG